MNIKRPILLAALLLSGAAAPASAQDLRDGLLQRFDLDRDGRLNAQEREAAREYLTKHRPHARPSTRVGESQSQTLSLLGRLRAQYDLDGDGTLSAEEAALARDMWRKLRARTDLSSGRGASPLAGIRSAPRSRAGLTPVLERGSNLESGPALERRQLGFEPVQERAAGVRRDPAPLGRGLERVPERASDAPRESRPAPEVRPQQPAPWERAERQAPQARPSTPASRFTPPRASAPSGPRASAPRGAGGAGQARGAAQGGQQRGARGPRF